MYQTTPATAETFAMLNQPKKMTDVIVELVRKANELIQSVTPDYHINDDTGAIIGKRLRPSLSGEQHFEQSQIGYVSLGWDGVNNYGNYYKNEPFAQRIETIEQLHVTRLDERIANLKDPNAQVTGYETVNVASTFSGIFVEALAVALSEAGFLAEMVSVPNMHNPSVEAAVTARVGYQNHMNAISLRMTREQFMDKWTRTLTGSVYRSAFADLDQGAQTNEQPVVEVDNQADEQ
jgi:hypothetical protein